MKIVNRKKFIRMIILMFGIIAITSFGFTNISFSKGEVKEKTIYIINGDTLWSIASNEKENNAYYEEKDIRDIVHEIKEINNIENNSILSVGEKLIVNSL